MCSFLLYQMGRSNNHNFHNLVCLDNLDLQVIEKGEPHDMESSFRS